MKKNKIKKRNYIFYIFFIFLFVFLITFQYSFAKFENCIDKNFSTKDYWILTKFILKNKKSNSCLYQINSELNKILSEKNNKKISFEDFLFSFIKIFFELNNNQNALNILKSKQLINKNPKYILNYCLFNYNNLIHRDKFCRLYSNLYLFNEIGKILPTFLYFDSKKNKFKLINFYAINWLNRNLTISSDFWLRKLYWKYSYHYWADLTIKNYWKLFILLNSKKYDFCVSFYDKYWYWNWIICKKRDFFFILWHFKNLSKTFTKKNLVKDFNLRFNIKKILLVENWHTILNNKVYKWNKIINLNYYKPSKLNFYKLNWIYLIEYWSSWKSTWPHIHIWIWRKYNFKFNNKLYKWYFYNQAKLWYLLF